MRNNLSVMKITQSFYAGDRWHNLDTSEGFSAAQAQLVLVFGERTLLEQGHWYAHFKETYPAASILLCSTSGEIYQSAAHEGTVVATAIQFEKTQIRKAQASISNYQQSFEAGKSLSASLQGDDLKMIFVLSDGSKVNGSDLIKGINENLSAYVSVSGGLAGDAARFEKTLVGLDAEPTEGQIVAIGLYGKDLEVGHGTMGGWDVFGPERQITKSSYNILYEFGGKKALDLYKEYLGKYASELPGAALLFPLSMKISQDTEPVVRTILSIDENDGSMVFAGEMPEGAYVNLMKANFDRLIDAAATAAEQTLLSPDKKPDLAILVSCVGRRLALGQRIDEEIEAAKEIFGEHTFMTGFYSYGEISPLATGKCDLHNQTMTITTLTESR
jgi:hypothetical protein